MPHKTVRMQRLEEEHGRPIEVLISLGMYRGLSDRDIGRELGLDRTTVFKYRKWFGIRRDKMSGGVARHDDSSRGA